MNKAPLITTIKEKKLVGHAIEMSLANNKNQELFSGFMPNRKQITNVIGTDVFEVLVYDASYFKNFSPNNTFTKWATVEVKNFDTIPDKMQSFVLDEGLYAVFRYKGLAKDFSMMMQYIFMEWFPKSDYTLDTRPHFNLLGGKTKKDSIDSEEDVYIPIKKKVL